MLEKVWSFIVGKKLKSASINQLLADVKAHPENYAPHPNGGGLVHKTASVAASAFVGEGSFVGPNAQIKDNVWLGTEVYIGSGTSIEKEARVCRASVVEDSCSLGERASVGMRGQLGLPLNEETENFIVIGRNTQVGHHAAFLSSSRVGANCQIGDHAIIDFDVKIRDNCRIGSGAFLVQATVGEGTAIGDRSKIGVTFQGINWPKIKIGKACHIGRKVDFYASARNHVQVGDGAKWGGSVRLYGHSQVAAGYDNYNDDILWMFPYRKAGDCSSLKLMPPTAPSMIEPLSATPPSPPPPAPLPANPQQTPQPVTVMPPPVADSQPTPSTSNVARILREIHGKPSQKLFAAPSLAASSAIMGH